MAMILDEALAALAEPTRRHVVDLLREGPRPAGHLASASGMSRPAMSKHLRVLRRSGLVEEEISRRDARVRIYRLRREPFESLAAWLDQVQLHWTEQLNAFKDYVDIEKRGESS